MYEGDFLPSEVEGQSSLSRLLIEETKDKS